VSGATGETTVGSKSSAGVGETIEGGSSIGDVVKVSVAVEEAAGAGDGLAVQVKAAAGVVGVGEEKIGTLHPDISAPQTKTGISTLVSKVFIAWLARSA